MIYIFDTSSLITPFRLYYAEDIAPSFWKKLEVLARNGTVCLIDKVKNEITKLDDELSKKVKQWFPKAVPFSQKASNDNLFISLFSEEEEKSYREVIFWAESSTYNKRAIEEFKEADKADAFVIAFCKAHGLVLVTEEKFSRKKKRIPIPNACKELGVKYINIFDFMRREGIQL